jgi:hypothetical protein
MTRTAGTGLALVVTCAALACGRPPQTLLDEDAERPPTAGMLAPVDPRQPLPALLEVLERELIAVQQAPTEAEQELRMLRAEAITDHLLEADAPFDYLREGYYLAARLRQIQARADRIVAQLRRSRMPGRFATTPFPESEVAQLRQEVAALRGALAAGGAPPPIPLDSLLAPYRGIVVRGDVGGGGPEP